MPAYLLLLVAVLSRLLPHAGMWNFTAVGGALLYFGARRSWREMLAPLAALMATDYVITVYMVHYAFRWQDYATTWAWYLMAMVLGQILLKARTTVVRVGAGSLLGPTSFFVVSNYAVWVSSGMYPHDASGLLTCYTMALPFYRNDVVSTVLVAGLAFGLPVLARRMNWVPAQTVAAVK
jgi:DMSO reductase anchor subunit